MWLGILCYRPCAESSSPRTYRIVTFPAGHRSLWAGVGNKMVTSMLHAAVMFSVVELFRAFNRMFARKHLRLK